MDGDSSAYLSTDDVIWELMMSSGGCFLFMGRGCNFTPFLLSIGSEICWNPKTADSRML